MVQKEPRFVNRALRSLPVLRKRINDNVLRRLVLTCYPPGTLASLALCTLPHSSSSQSPRHERRYWSFWKRLGPGHISPLVSKHCSLLLGHGDQQLAPGETGCAPTEGKTTPHSLFSSVHAHPKVRLPVPCLRLRCLSIFLCCYGNWTQTTWIRCILTVTTHTLAFKTPLLPSGKEL